MSAEPRTASPRGDELDLLACVEHEWMGIAVRESQDTHTRVHDECCRGHETRLAPTATA